MRDENRKFIFSDIYNRKLWGGLESASGPGSDMNETKAVRRRLPEILKKLKIQTFLDTPCGDFHWMRYLDYSFKQYIGMDIVPKLIASNKKLYGSKHRRFIVGDIVKDSIPKVDLILCRDCLGHLPFKEAVIALKNFKKSGSLYLIATTFPETTDNSKVRILSRQRKKVFRTGDFRPINLQLPPFNLPKPIVMINERHTIYKKILGLWKL